MTGRFFIQRTIFLDDIASVDWSMGQASGMAGRDMNDWQVWIQFDHHDPKVFQVNEKRNAITKSTQDLYSIGSAAHKDKTKALGLSLIALLCDAGVDLVQDLTITKSGDRVSYQRCKRDKVREEGEVS